MTIRFWYVWNIKWPIERWFSNRREERRRKQDEARLNAAAQDTWAERVVQCQRMEEGKQIAANQCRWGPPKAPADPVSRTLTFDEAVALFEQRAAEE